MSEHNKRLKVMGLGGLTLAAVLVAAGISARAREAHAVAEWTEARTVPVVSLAKTDSHGGGSDLLLPAHLSAWAEAPINARISGYLKDWTSDIGTQVSAGQVLAHIDSPELDQQVAQARAHLLQEQAVARLARTSAERWQHLLDSHSVARQEVDEKVANAAAADADVAAARADLDRLQALEDYKTLRAPFAGTLTARHTDVGQLIKADDATGQALFAIANTRKLRLYVPVPQNYSSVIQPGLTVQLQVPEHPGQQFSATLIGSSTAVDRQSGTLLAQFEVDNPNDALLPGDYAEAHLPVKADGKGVSIPASALVFRAAGTQVAVLDAEHKVHLRKVHIGLDLGATLYIDQGLSETDQVVDNPPDALREGDAVQLAQQETAHAAKA